MASLRHSPLPVLGAAFGAILVILAVMVAASDSVGRALVARHETEVQLAELSYGLDRLQTRVSEQIDSYQDFLRAPAPLRLQLYRAAHQAVADQLAALRQETSQHPEVATEFARLAEVADQWDAELHTIAQAAPQSRESVLQVAPTLGARADEVGAAYMAALRAYQERLEELRADNRQTGQTLADQFQLVARVGGLLGALLVLGVGVVTSLTIRRSIQELAASRRAVVQAQETVRRDVAERLHGEVQGKLLALELQLRQAADEIARDPGTAETSVRGVIERLEVVRNTTRAVSHQLHPAILRMGLPAALRSLRDALEPAVTVRLDIAPEVEARELRRSFGVAEGSVPVPEEARLALYRLVQEAVNNAVRHGGVTEVAVRVWSPRADQLAVTVADRGRGFARSERGGLGLASLRGAMEAVGGRLEVASAAGTGTRVLGMVPLPAPAPGPGPGRAAPEAPAPAPGS
jgi:signal transduction histidine kinase